MVTIQEQHPFGQDHHGRPHHAVFISQGGGVLDPSLDHQEKAKEEFLNSARRGHEDDGGEGSVSERKGDTPEGWTFLPSPPLDSALTFSG